ncbi:aspartoacylase [Aliikangiella marina]|uniref:Aspartoacylase n=1 Tax=Aliikangiella marina TaxID=1712262 RepID=A0A545TGX7_9GAMM|nr:aspartoacylase [Aliikangiella marina]TQV76477.1 aspartoacylase [Aliikangiella marina]
MAMIETIVIAGGTHGNELTGVNLVRHWRDNHYAVNHQPLTIELLQANPAAINANKRYLEKDLNRCFKLSELADPKANNQEQQLAKQINQQLGPKGDARVDFIIDLHTSTANMQTNIVLIKMDDFHLKLAAYLKQQLANVVITSESRLMDDHHFLCSIADKGIVVEVGPIPQGAIEYDAYQKTESAVKKAIEFADRYNRQQLPDLGESLEVMSYFSKVYFPTTQNDEINAAVHPDLIHQDYSQITTGTPIFKSFDGEDIYYQGENAHIAFVNEAAYYDQKIALCLCNPIRYCLTSLKPLG